MNESPFLLALDYGKAKVGVAVGSLVPSMPLEVVRYSSDDFLVREVLRIVEQERPEGLLLGWPADYLNKSTPQTEEIQSFGEMLSGLTSLPVIYYPETLTTQLAERRMIEAGLSQKRRKEMGDSYAAAAILDSYLESLA